MPDETVEPVGSLDELEELVTTRLGTINSSASSYDQGRAEELQWVLDQINPPEEEEPDEDVDEDTDEPEVFAKPGTATATKATTPPKK